MKLRRGDILLFCIICLLILLLVILVYATEMIPTCMDVNAVQKGTALVRTCNNVSVQDTESINITARSNKPSIFIINYTGGTIPFGSAIGEICVNFTLLIENADTAIANGVNITFWKESSNDYFRIITEMDTFTSTYSTYKYCNNTIITTVNDANAFNVYFGLKGDATNSDDIFSFNYVQTNISYAASTAPEINNVTIVS